MLPTRYVLTVSEVPLSTRKFQYTQQSKYTRYCYERVLDWGNVRVYLAYWRYNITWSWLATLGMNVDSFIRDESIMMFTSNVWIEHIICSASMYRSCVRLIIYLQLISVVIMTLAGRLARRIRCMFGSWAGWRQMKQPVGCLVIKNHEMVSPTWCRHYLHLDDSCIKRSSSSQQNLPELII